MNAFSGGQFFDDFAAILPMSTRNYLAHTVEGRGIREIAREMGCHASTVLRQVRKTESMRDDPIVDMALDKFSSPEAECTNQQEPNASEVIAALRHLCMPGAMMLFTQSVPQPAIVQTQGDGDTRGLATVTIDVAASLILRGWVTGSDGTSVIRYGITSEGRAAVPALVAAQDNAATKDQMGISGGLNDQFVNLGSRTAGSAFGAHAESPLAILARRKQSNGRPFLTPDFVAAGDRLFEDFQISGLRETDVLGWSDHSALDPLYARAKKASDPRHAKAMTRVLDAISDLGPGLSDVALRCCCLREGLEATEKRMGWSARSGKVVLRIALQRLSLYYARNHSAEGALIG